MSRATRRNCDHKGFLVPLRMQVMDIKKHGATNIIKLSGEKVDPDLALTIVETKSIFCLNCGMSCAIIPPPRADEPTVSDEAKPDIPAAGPTTQN